MCTRVFNNLNFQHLTTARNMDWMFILPTSLFVFEKNLQKTGIATKKQLSVLRWVQYVLDNFVFAKDVVKAFQVGDIQLVGDNVPHSENKPASAHLCLSDASGNSAIIEVYKGKFYFHESPNYKIMTNEPDYATQLKLDDYWQWQWSSKNPHPSHTIPGGAFSADRFERASFYISHVDSPDSESESIAQARTVAANASVPIGYNFTDTNSPNISNTLWTTLATHKSLKYFFQNIRTPSVVWTDLSTFEFLQPASKVDLITLDDQSKTIPCELQGEINQAYQATLDPYKA